MDVPPKIAGRYLMQEEIGRGGMGVVFRARDEKFDAEVAVKVLSPERGATDAAARLKREAKLGNLLGRQDGIVRALDWGELPGGRLYLVIDFVDGAGDLDVTRGPLLQRIERVYEAARLVAKAHAAGVVHRDVKPANFLVDRAGRLHLTDFGIAKELGAEEAPAPATLDPDEPVTLAPELTGKNVGLGTPFYMPPEQFEDAARVDQRADVYALGVMLFQALTGALPYSGRTPAEVFTKVMKARYGEIPRPSVREHVRAIPRALERVVDQALASTPGERFPSVEALIAALDAADWRVGLRGVAGPGAHAGSDAATVAYGASTRGARGTTTGAGAGATLAKHTAAIPEEPAAPPSDGCPGCGHRPLRSTTCPACGADVIALRTQDRLELQREREARAAAERLRRQRAQVSGASLDYGGFQIPKVAWFLGGVMLVTGVLLKVDWGGGAPRDPQPTPAADAPADAPAEEVELVDAEELTPLGELRREDAADLELFRLAHDSWRRWNDYEQVDDREAEVLNEVPELETRFESYRLTYADEVPVTEARTRRYSFRVQGRLDPEVRARVAKD